MEAWRLLGIGGVTEGLGVSRGKTPWEVGSRGMQHTEAAPVQMREVGDGVPTVGRTRPMAGA